ncbi:hypothetical protein [Comamonas sp. w2-DMI]|uniref:hypothetical protein n=1 Tax=Comamonas sp. w2-DMI TaxID=3126391 RepID=UPI0032E488A9
MIDCFGVLNQSKCLIGMQGLELACDEALQGLPGVWRMGKNGGIVVDRFIGND